MKPIGKAICVKCGASVSVVETDDYPPVRVFVEDCGPVPGVGPRTAIGNPMDHSVEGLLERAKWYRGPVLVEHAVFCQPQVDERVLAEHEAEKKAEAKDEDLNPHELSGGIGSMMMRAGSD